jgi:hypothetical protein
VIEQKKSGFSRLLLQTSKNMLLQESHFAKWFAKMTSAPLVEPFVKLSQKNNNVMPNGA